MPTTSPTPHTVEALLRVVEERDSEVVFLKLMVDKLTLQLLRARRAQYGRSSEQLDDPQIALIEGAPLYEHPAPKAAPKPDAANSAGIDRQLPAHLPRENQVHRLQRPMLRTMRPATPAAVPRAVVLCARSASTCRNNSSTCRRASR